MVFLSLLLNFALAQEFTINIQGAGSFLEPTPIAYDTVKQTLNLTAISCVRSDGTIFDDGLEKKLFFKTGKSGGVHVIRSIQYDLTAKVINVVPVYPLVCTPIKTSSENEESLED